MKTITSTEIIKQLDTTYQEYFNERIPEPEKQKITYITNTIDEFILQIQTNNEGKTKQKNYYNLTSLNIRQYPVNKEYTYDMTIRTINNIDILLFDQYHTLEEFHIIPIQTQTKPNICEVTLDQMEEGFEEILGNSGTYIAVPTNGTITLYLVKQR